MSKKSAAVAIPHSWRLKDWPPIVFPSTENGARWLVRAHRKELILAGVLVRVGRDLVVMGARYSQWLEKQAHRVPGYEIAPNADKAA